MSERKFPPPWTVETIPGGLKVCGANGQSLAYVYSRENPNDAHMAKAVSAPPSRLLSDIVRYAACLILGDFSCAPRNRGIGNDVLVSGIGAG